MSQGDSRNGVHTVVNIYIVHNLIDTMLPPYFFFMYTVVQDHVNGTFEFAARSIYEANSERGAVKAIISDKLFAGYFRCAIGAFTVERYILRNKVQMDVSINGSRTNINKPRNIIIPRSLQRSESSNNINSIDFIRII